MTNRTTKVYLEFKKPHLDCFEHICEYEYEQGFLLEYLDLKNLGFDLMFIINMCESEINEMIKSM